MPAAACDDARRRRGRVSGVYRKRIPELDPVDPRKRCVPGPAPRLRGHERHIGWGETFAELAAGFGIGTATAWRYVTETVGLLAARSPKLPTALRDAKQPGHAYVVIDGTLIPIDRVAADRPFYSGKHRRHDMNLQVIATPDGGIVWVSGPLPGAVHDLTAARIWGILRRLAASGLVVLADKAYHGAGDHIRTPYRGSNKPAS